MANRTYLCSSPSELIYPSFSQEGYDAEAQTIATDVYCIPLLWMAAFRPEDIKEHTFSVDGQEIPAWAPLAKKTKALGQLKETEQYINEQFKNQGSLSEHIQLLAKAIEEAPHPYITIELEEIEALHEEGLFRDVFTECLIGFRDKDSYSGPELPVTGMKKFFGAKPQKASHIGQLLDITAIKSHIKIPNAMAFKQNEKMSEDEVWNLVRVLGVGHIKSVPWE